MNWKQRYAARLPDEAFDPEEWARKPDPNKRYHEFNFTEEDPYSRTDNDIPELREDDETPVPEKKDPGTYQVHLVRESWRGELGGMEASPYYTTEIKADSAHDALRKFKTEYFKKYPYGTTGAYGPSYIENKEYLKPENCELRKRTGRFGWGGSEGSIADSFGEAAAGAYNPKPQNYLHPYHSANGWLHGWDLQIMEEGSICIRKKLDFPEQDWEQRLREQQ